MSIQEFVKICIIFRQEKNALENILTKASSCIVGSKMLKKYNLGNLEDWFLRCSFFRQFHYFSQKNCLLCFTKLSKAPNPTELYYCVDEFTTWLTDNKSFCNKISEENSTDLKGKSNLVFYKHYKCKK